MHFLPTLLITNLLGFLGGCAVAEPEQICLMSKVSGQLVKDGQPLPNTKLVRQLSYVYKDSVHIDERITDVEGNFSFPPV